MLQISIPVDAKTRSCLCSSIFPTASLILLVFFFGTFVLVPEQKQSVQILTRSGAVDSFTNLNSTANGQDQERPQESETLPQPTVSSSNLNSANSQDQERSQESEALPQATVTSSNVNSANSQDRVRPQGSETLPQGTVSSSNLNSTTCQGRPQGSETLPQSTVSSSNPNPDNCQDRDKPQGSETLPQGMVERTSNLQMRPLWGRVARRRPNERANLFAAAVGAKQKDLVNKMVTKFLASHFTVMLFHYDGSVDQWNEFDWSSNVIHVSAHNQTKWWFAKRFMHPDIVAEYDYVFLWDEDIGVDTFDPLNYVSIVTREGLEISQPALDIMKSEIHQQITGRSNSKAPVHRRIYKQGSCDASSTKPPCTGWVEMMTPVFSRKAWRCVWYMIQNDLIHAWGLDYRLGYCAQGDRTQKMGIVDAEYVVHYGRPTLGGSDKKDPPPQVPRNPHELNPRVEVRRQSWNEYKVFKRRWAKAAEDDKCFVDPYRDEQLP